MPKTLLLKLVVFISAFLLFQIELIVAKILLPQYGGSYLVWGACVVFFQAVLMVGYIFSHFCIQKFGISRYRLYHLILVFIPLFFFPGRDLNFQYTQNNIPLAIDVFYRLLITIGPVFFTLSTVSLVFQIWFAKSYLPKNNNPYTLYSVSNFGSFLALFTYPFIFEVYCDLSQQEIFWGMLYGVFMLLNGLVYFLVPVKEELKKEETQKLSLQSTDVTQWFLLGAAGVVLFLSVNNIVTYEVAPVPLLWVFPLSIYLLTFVLNFNEKPWCPSWITEKIHIHLGLATLLFFMIYLHIFPVLIQAVLILFVLFILCMYCQNRLYLSKPSDPQALTFFYVIVSLGGFIGGLVVSWIVPLISKSLVEFLIGLVLIALTLNPHQKIERVGAYNIRLVLYLTAVLLFWPVAFPEYNIWVLISVTWIFVCVFKELNKNRYALILALACILCIEFFGTNRLYVHHKRNYYGIYKIFDEGPTRLLYHGTTLHGLEFLDSKIQAQPTTYYGHVTLVGAVLRDKTFDFKRIGVIGLGAGTLATYVKSEQIMDFYELDRHVYAIATEYFDFIAAAKGKINYIFGDARLSLQKLSNNIKYDLLIVDAFGGDSIPFHLITKEMIAEYRKHLTDKGILMIHVSNRYIEIGPVVASTANNQGAYVGIKQSPTDAFSVQAQWLAMTWDKEVFKTLLANTKCTEIPKEKIKAIRPWSDGYSNILPTLRIERVINDVKNFRLLYW